MRHDVFRESSEHFRAVLSAVNNATDSYIPQAIKALERVETSPDATREQSAELALEGISVKIRDLAASYNNMLKALEFGPDFNL